MKNGVVILVVTGLIALISCASENRKTSMDGALRLYEKSIKWGSYRDAQTLTEKPITAELLDQYKDIEVISYEVVRQEMVGDFEQLNQIVEIKFYHKQQGTIRTVRDTQVWNYNEDRETWVLQTGLPDFMSVVE